MSLLGKNATFQMKHDIQLQVTQWHWDDREEKLEILRMNK